MVMFAISGLGQATPTITSIVSGGSYNPGMLASGGLGTILGSGLSGATYSAPGLPWPTTLGNTTVQVCYDGESCVPAQLTYAAASQINFLIPTFLVSGHNGCFIGSGITDGQCSATVTVSVETSSSDPRTINVAQFAPDMFIEGYDCWIDPTYPSPALPRATECGLNFTPAPSNTIQAVRAAITDESGAILYSGNPAKLGGYYTIWLTGVVYSQASQHAGLGVSISLSDVPECCDPSITTNENIPPSYVGLTQFPGLYQINFQLPLDLTVRETAFGPNFPCNVTYEWEIGVQVTQAAQLSYQQTFYTSIPVVVYPGDLPCS
jgi:hypothetical protein